MRAASHRVLAILTGLFLNGAPARGDEASEHWSFQPIQRPAVPETDASNPIDAFIDTELARRQLTPAPKAPPPLLLRRVFLDLIGLPPTRKELRAFLADGTDFAFERAVDRLLESPQHGERWGRHWMDVWRYSDWFGNEGKDRITNALPHLWHWRDWIVESINAGKGYDRMILEMLAGDEIKPIDQRTLRATGFLVRNRYRLDRNVPLMATVEHTGRAFLGLTLDCARCHEHKYDPITHEDYYAFRAFFEPMGFRTDRVPGQPDIIIDGLPRIYDADLEAATYLFEKGDERRPEKEKPLKARLPVFFEKNLPGGQSLEISEIPLPAQTSNPFLQEWVIEGEAKRLTAEIERLEKAFAKKKSPLSEKQIAAANARFHALGAVRTADLVRNSHGSADESNLKRNALAASNAQRKYKIAKAEVDIALAEEKAEKFREQFKTDPSKKAQLDAAEKEIAKYEAEREKAAASKPSVNYEPLGEIYPEKSTGRRRALARWLISERNPLTARVAVNHIWMRHFGEALVPTVFDFGLAGKPPTHPELLDWLAAEFVESGWT